MEEKLINDLITRLANELPIVKGKFDWREDAIIKENEKALIEFSVYKLGFIVNGISVQLDKLIKMQTANSDEMTKLCASQHYFLDLLCLCLTKQWDHIRAELKNFESHNENEKIRIKEIEETILPPPLEDRLAKELLRILIHFVTRTHLHFHNELMDKASKGLYQLSASNFETIISSISQYMSPNSPASEEEIISQINLFDLLNFNSKNLSDLLVKMGKFVSTVKKESIRICCARVIRKAIWNWIDKYPMEFVKLQSNSKGPMGGQPDVLFDIFDGWASSTSKKAYFWPTCTMLLILCPDIFLRIVQTSVHKEEVSKEKFMESLKKALRTSKTADVAAICYVDICKASTYVSKGDLSGLRHLVPEIETELKERLFNPSQPFKNSDGVVDENLMVDYLLSTFYLSPRKVINSIFTECVKPGSSIIFRRVLVRTLLRITREAGNLPWNPTISDIYSIHAGNLRSLFQEFVVMLREYPTLIGQSDKKSKAQVEKILSEIDILDKLICLFKEDPALALFPQKTSDKDMEDIKLLLTGLCDCVSQYQLFPSISFEAINALLTLHKPENIERWCPKSGVDGFWNISSTVNAMLSTILIEQIDLDPTFTEKLIPLLEKILTDRNQYLENVKDSQPSASTKAIRYQASSKLESAFLILLINGNSDIISRAVNCFGLLCAEVDILRSWISDTDNTIACNYESYKQLAATGGLSTGRQAQQKAIRNWLKKVERYTVGNFIAWEEVYNRWQLYTTVILKNEESAAAAESKKSESKPKKDDAKKKTKASASDVIIPKYMAEKSPADLLFEWNNALGILCSLAAVAINQEKQIKIQSEKKGKGGKEETINVLENFINELMELLVSEYVNVREAAKMMLGTSLSPPAFSVLFKVLHTQAKNIFGKAGQVNFSNDSMLFVDQAISIMKLILENQNSADDLSLLTDFEDLIMTLLRFVRQLTISISSLQTRHKLCSLIESLMKKSNLLTFKAEYQFRSDLIENIMEWTSEFSTKESNIPQDLAANAARQIAKIIKELDVQVMQTISHLLNNLPLQGKDDEAKSNTFSKYFTFFTNLLTRCKRNPQSVLTPQLPEATIQSLSFLVTANIEHGLDYFVTMGYHEDFETRSAFLKVLTNILKEGTEFDNSGEVSEKYYKLTELILDGNLDVILTLCEVTNIADADHVAQLLVRVFESNDKTMELLKASITQEVMKTESANTLFRLNSMATKLLAAYCKMLGSQYLKVALGPQLRSLMNNFIPLELNDPKLSEADLATNRKNVISVCEKFLVDIKASIPQCPGPLREICKFLKQIVSEKFPGSEHTAIAGFIFLRFLCPAIVAPDGYGVISQDIQDKDLRRGLVLVTKVLQNLANRVLFTKERFMECMNPFIDANLSLIRDMFDTYASEPEVPPPLPAITFPEEQKLEDMGRLHYFISISMEKMSKIWSTQKGNTLSSRLNNILSQLGQPPEPGAKARDNIASVVGGGNIASQGQNIHYEKFMARMANKDVENIRQRDIYFQHGKTKKGVPVFYYIARNFRQDMDIELFNYYLLKTTQPAFSKPFSIVIDLTLFSNDNQLTIPMCTALAKIIPDLVMQNLDSVYLLNANTWFKKYSKRVSKVVYRVQKKFVFCPNLSKLLEFINEGELGLPAYSTSIDKNVQSTFSPVTKVGQYNKRSDVTLKISTDLLQIITKEYSIFNQVTTLTDIIKISQVIDIEAYSNKDEFALKYDQNGQKTIYFYSTSSEQIVQQLSASKDRYKLSQPQNSLARSKAFRPADVPGTLMNMALLNLLSSNHTLRVSSYNLLVSLLASFSFSTRSLFVESYDIAVPKSCRHFVLRISKELANSVQSLTLDFLLEAIQGFSKSEKISQVLVLDYIKPWLYNLKDYCCALPSPAQNQNNNNNNSGSNGANNNNSSGVNNQENTNKVRDIINSLIALSIREYNEIGTVIISKTWKILGRVPESFDVVINCLFDRAAANKGSSPLGSKDMDCYEEIVVSMASQNSKLVTGKIIAIFSRILRDSSDPSIERIEFHPNWIKIEVLIRWLLALSNDNLIDVSDYLSDLLFLVVLTFFSGDILIRSNVYTLYLNTIHSILVSNLCNTDKLQTLKIHFGELHQGQSKFFFGIGGKNINVSPYQKSQREEKLEKLQISMVENLTTSIFTILSCCSPSINCIGSPYHQRMLEHCYSFAFQQNLFLQPRAIACLGVLCPSSSLVSDQLIDELLKILRFSLAASNSGKKYHEDLSISIVVCLAKLYEHLDSNSKYFKPLIWVALSLIQVHDASLFMVSVHLLEVIIKTMFDRGFFKGQGLAAFCLEARSGSFKTALEVLDQLNGFNFAFNFSFALAGHLLKGMKNPATKAATAKLLTTLINNSSESNYANLLGYLCALLPNVSDDVAYLRQVLPSEEDRSLSIFHPLLFPDKVHGAFFFAMYAAILKNSDSEHEQIYIYKSFEEGIQFMPESFPVTYDVLIPKMDQILNSSQNDTIISHVLSIMNSMAYYSLETGSVVNFTNKQILQSTGFTGIPESDLFQSKFKSTLVQNICSFLECV